MFNTILPYGSNRSNQMHKKSLKSFFFSSLGFVRKRVICVLKLSDRGKEEELKKLLCIFFLNFWGLW